MFNASRAQFSAATVAANEVDFLDPLNPDLPAEPHTTVFPWRSVIVISVLLNVAVMCAIPSDSTTFFDRFVVPRVWAMIYFFTAFFFPAMGRLGPFFVRAFVCVRWPRTGRFRRCRVPL